MSIYIKYLCTKKNVEPIEDFKNFLFIYKHKNSNIYMAVLL